MTAEVTPQKSKYELAIINTEINVSLIGVDLTTPNHKSFSPAQN